MMQYRIPKEFYYRIHHCRPRFKNNVESVLVFMAEQISSMPELSKSEFDSRMNAAIRLFPGNIARTEKTINNWRTEISSLFGLVQYSNDDARKASIMSCHLAKQQDLVAFFKYFCFYFQYPGGHLKPHFSMEFIQASVLFKPAKYILKLLFEGARYTEGEKRFYITKAEVTHCIFNDLRVSRDCRDHLQTIELILKNRKEDKTYDCGGDVTRYAGDILDYMVLANLLVCYGSNYVLNMNELEAVAAFIESDLMFEDYADLALDDPELLDKVTDLQRRWFDYVNKDINTELFSTDVLSYLGLDKQDFEKKYVSAISQLYEKIDGSKEIKTKEIGDVGECLIHGHECMKIKLSGREDLIHLIVVIPNQFAVGYDIQSVNPDETKKYIEVKTTISSKRLVFNSFHLTPNEWNTADSTGDIYNVYRLLISRQGVVLYVINNPIRLYKADALSASLASSGGFDVTFDTETAGNFEELLAWEN